MSTEDELFEALKYRRRSNDYDFWVNDAGELHRVDNPAVIRDNGAKEWFLNGVRHRKDGPARECANGDNEWYVNGRYHREDGPAVEYKTGAKFWYFNGFRVVGDAQLLFDNEDGRNQLARAYGRPE